MAETEVLIKKRTKTALKPPKKFDVIFLNDDVTTVEFVAITLMTIFSHTDESAKLITEKIHNEGRGVVGTYWLEIAEQKVYETLHGARLNNFPLSIEVKETS